MRVGFIGSGHMGSGKRDAGVETALIAPRE
jgi:hypothetical protein